MQAVRLATVLWWASPNGRSNTERTTDDGGQDVDGPPELVGAPTWLDPGLVAPGDEPLPAVVALHAANATGARIAVAVILTMAARVRLGFDVGTGEWLARAGGM